MVTLLPAVQKFVLHWGEMGTRWGVNRTVAQVHALLYASPRPLNAEEIAKTLSVARSNVSTSLRELESWGIVKPVHLLGDRREHYVSMTDIWEMARVILDERKRREIDPTLITLRECVAELKKGGTSETVTRERLLEMLDFLETLAALYEEVHRMPTGAVRGLLKVRGKMRKLFKGPAAT
ncbi:MAG TPA: MarR family transcriptional regulator [Terriglobia bacterium]|nr:MarR family transcriptional regulator [Terriglobia bacterium]